MNEFSLSSKIQLFRRIILVTMMFYSIFFQGCSKIIRRVPVQMARCTIVDFYSHWYDLKDIAEAQSALTRLIGEENFNTLLKYRSDKKTQQFLLDKKITIKGGFSLTISLMPTNPDSFFLDGIGRYFVINDTTAEILFSADFFIKSHNNCYAIQELKTGELRVRVNHIIIRHFAYKEDKLNYYQDVVIDFCIKLNTQLADKKIYCVNYEASHDVKINGDLIGHLRFEPPASNWAKLIDLRGLNFIRNDYSKLIKKTNKTIR